MPSNAQSPVLQRWEQKQDRDAQERRSVLYTQWRTDVGRLYEAHRVFETRAEAQWQDLEMGRMEEDSRREVSAAHASRMEVLAKVEGQHAPMFWDADMSHLVASQQPGVCTLGQRGEPASRTSAGRSRAPDAVSGREAPTGSASAQQSGRTVQPSILGKRQAPAMARWAPKRRTTTQISTTGLNEKVSVESDSSLSSLGPDTPSTPDRFRLSGEQTGDADLQAFLTMSSY